MPQGESPAVARRRVRLALRRAREEKGLTQGQVATALEWSLSKVQRIESGEVSVSTTDLRALLGFFGISGGETVDVLMRDARTSRRQRWYTDPRYREELTPATRQLLQFESEATAIRAYVPLLIPGLLQTSEYAGAVFDSRSTDLSDSQRKVRYEVRMRRRGQVLDRRDPPDYLLILDESVLRRDVGGPQIFVRQLEELIEMGRRPNVHIRVVPFREAVVALLGPFTVFDLGEDEDAVLYTEGYYEDRISQAPDEVQRHRAVFEDLWSRSIDEAASERLIHARAATMLSWLDRQTFPS
jgi:transcriptional regulator with XRE-family HTH domain